MNKIFVFLFVASLFIVHRIESATFSHAVPHAIASDSNGTIYCVATALVQGINQWSIASVTLTGQPNATFGTDSTGIVITPLGTNDQLNALTIKTSDNTIFVAGSVTNIPTIGHYLTTGSLDTGFGTSSLAQIAGSGFFNGVAIDSSGNIVGCGTSIVDSSATAVVASFTSTGAANSSFGLDGVVTATFGDQSYLKALVTMTDGSIIAGGSISQNSVKNSLVMKYTSAGVFDTTFGGSGFVTLLPEVDTPSEIRALYLQGDNKIVAVGNVGNADVPIATLFVPFVND